jgi:cytoskeletal protein RodZ
MPERYRGGHTPMVESKPPSPSTPSKPSTPPPPPKPPPLPTGKPPPPKKKSNTKVLLVAGVLVLIALGLSGFFLLQTLQAPEPEPEIPAVLPPPPTGEGEVTEETGGEEETVETTEPFPVTARPGTDSDSDGLTDVEEQSIYGTDPFLPDTDADGFLDGNEVFHRYNPNGTAPGTLEAAGLVKPYNASVAVGADPLPYGILYPAVWSLTGDDPVNIIFESSTSEQIRVTVSAKAAGEALASWLTSQGTDPTSFRGSTTKNGLSLLLSEDQLTAYVDGGEKVLTLRYDLGIKGSIDYLQTFQMMLNSLSF